MYEAYFGLVEKPFALVPDSSFLYLSPKHAMALSMLEYSLTGQAGFTVVSGEVGAGKTTLIRYFLKQVDYGTVVGLISNTHSAFGDLMQWVLMAFDLRCDEADKAVRFRRFADYLLYQHRAGRRTILIIDEAQNLSTEVLEELRLLSNLNADRQELLQIILVGQPELLDKLKRPDLRQFAQRVTVHYHLQPLSFVETCGYVRHRLTVAGGNPRLFDVAAIGAVHAYSQGVPRLINSLCDMALVYAYADGAKVIGFPTIFAVAGDRGRGALLSLPLANTHLSREALTAHVTDLIEKAGPALEAAAPPVLEVVSTASPAPGAAETAALMRPAPAAPPPVRPREPGTDPRRRPPPPGMERRPLPPGVRPRRRKKKKKGFWSLW